jgi:hypothetical protein
MKHQVLLRHAVIGTLLRAVRPLSIGEITARVLDRRPVDTVVGPLSPKRMSDMLRFQVRQGRVRRVARGRYAAVPDGMGRTTRWRYQRWEHTFDMVVDEIAQLRATWMAPHPDPVEITEMQPEMPSEMRSETPECDRPGDLGR